MSFHTSAGPLSSPQTKSWHVSYFLLLLERLLPHFPQTPAWPHLPASLCPQRPTLADWNTPVPSLNQNTGEGRGGRFCLCPLCLKHCLLGRSCGPERVQSPWWALHSSAPTCVSVTTFFRSLGPRCGRFLFPLPFHVLLPSLSHISFEPCEGNSASCWAPDDWLCRWTGSLWKFMAFSISFLVGEYFPKASAAISCFNSQAILLSWKGTMKKRLYPKN